MYSTIVLSVLLWWVAFTRVRRWRQSHSVLALGIAVVFVCMAAHTTVNVGPVDRFVSNAIGVANAASAVKQGLFLGMCLGAALLLVALCVHDAGAQRRWVGPLSLGTVGAIVVAVVLFLGAADAPQARDGYQFDQLYGHLPGYAESAAFVMVVAAVLCTIITVVVVHGWDLGTPAGRGLAIVAVGVAVLSVYAWMRAGYIVAARAGWVEPSTHVFDVSTELALVGSVLTMLGFTWASIERFFMGRSQRRDFAELYQVLVKQRWPGVMRESWSALVPARQVSDRASEVLDALSMQADEDGLPERGRPATPESIARWVCTGESGGVGVDGLRPPSGTDTVKWVRAVGKAFEALRASGEVELQR